MSQTGSVTVCTIVAIVVAVVAAIGGGGYVLYKFSNDTPMSTPRHIDAEQIAYATTNMFHLFRDAQYDYIHRRGGKMAKSVTELGNGFSIGSFGSLIHEEIWLARFDRPEEEYVPEAQQSQLERNILARPYRYAILPVQDCNSPALDARTTCILAVPVANDDSPLLVLFAGPIRVDPGDFYRAYPVYEVSDETAREAFRNAVINGVPVDKPFLDRNLPNME